jgi:hypothetical protein
VIIDDLFKRQRLNAELVAINDIQQELSDLITDAVVTAMQQCRERKTNPTAYYVMLMTTMVSLMASQAHSLKVDRKVFLETVEKLYDHLSSKINEPLGGQH